MLRLFTGGAIALVAGILLYAAGREKLGMALFIAGSLATGIFVLFCVLFGLVALTSYDQDMD